MPLTRCEPLLPRYLDGESRRLRGGGFRLGRSQRLFLLALCHGGGSLGLVKRTV